MRSEFTAPDCDASFTPLNAAHYRTCSIPLEGFVEALLSTPKLVYLR
jgi:hypothetical protein